MGWFKNLFKKKVGGTVFGNILRNVGNRYSAGLYSIAFPVPLSLREMPGYSMLYPQETQLQTQRGFFDGWDIPDLGDVIDTVLDNLDAGEWIDDNIPEEVVDVIDTILGDTPDPDFAESVGLNANGDIIDPDLFNNEVVNVVPQQDNTPSGQTITNNAPIQNPSVTASPIGNFGTSAMSWIKENVVLFGAIVVVVPIAIYFIYKKIKK